MNQRIRPVILGGIFVIFVGFLTRCALVSCQPQKVETVSEVVVTRVVTENVVAEGETVIVTRVVTENENIQIQYVGYNPEKFPDCDHQYVEVINVADEPQDMTSWTFQWTVQDDINRFFTFPKFILQPGAFVRVCTGVGSDTETDLYGKSDSVNWNDGSNTATLKNSRGDIVDVYGYLVQNPSLRQTPVPSPTPNFGQVVYDVPKQMVREEEVQIILLVKPFDGNDLTNQPTDELEIELRSQLLDAGQEPSNIVTAKVKTAKRMSATLAGVPANAFEIVPLQENDEQYILDDAPTQWEWTVSPLKGGKHKLILRIERVLEIDGVPEHLKEEVYRDDVSVEVPLNVLLNEALASIWDFKWWIGLLIPAIVSPFVGYWLRNRQRTAVPDPTILDGETSDARKVTGGEESMVTKTEDLSFQGGHFQMLRHALLSAFNPSNLRAMVRIHLEEDLDEIVTKGPLKEQVEELIMWAEAHDRIEDLIVGARKENPSNNELKEAEAAILKKQKTAG